MKKQKNKFKVWYPGDKEKFKEELVLLKTPKEAKEFYAKKYNTPNSNMICVRQEKTKIKTATTAKTV